jgi:membrane peptidoglycan carboxypeptidase
MAVGYATFAAEGEQADWYVIEKVDNSDGKLVYEHKVTAERAFGADVAADVSYALQEVVTSGTGTEALALGCPVAGKTGTAALRPDTVTSAWFVGYTPRLAAAVMYIRGDGRRDLDGVGGLSTFFGGEYPARTFTAFMDKAGQDQDCVDFPEPAFLDGNAGTPSVAPTTQAPTTTPPPTTTKTSPPPETTTPTTPPTEEPTDRPTKQPTEEPTESPRPTPTDTPTEEPPETSPTSEPTQTPRPTTPPESPGNGNGNPGGNGNSGGGSNGNAGGDGNSGASNGNGNSNGNGSGNGSGGQ